MPNVCCGRVALLRCFDQSTKTYGREGAALKSTILWSFLSGDQVIPAAISGLRSMEILFASGSLRIASVLQRFLYVMVNFISSQVPCGPTGNCCEQNYISTTQNQSLKAQMI